MLISEPSASALPISHRTPSVASSNPALDDCAFLTDQEMMCPVQPPSVSATVPRCSREPKALMAGYLSMDANMAAPSK